MRSQWRHTIAKYNFGSIFLDHRRSCYLGLLKMSEQDEWSLAPLVCITTPRLGRQQPCQVLAPWLHPSPWAKRGHLQQGQRSAKDVGAPCELHF